MKYIVLKTHFLLFLLASPFLLAEELTFFVDSNFQACNGGTYNQAIIKTKYAEFKYNTETKELNIEVEFTNQNGGTLANGFHFGLNSETQLINNGYKLAYFYIDGKTLKANGEPSVTAYIYNREAQAGMSSCNNAPGSWQTTPPLASQNKTEKILLSSTPNTNPNWVSFAEMTQDTVAGVTTRKFSIIIDTAPIQAFIPNSSAEYQQEMAVACKPNCDYYNNPNRIFDFGRNVSGQKRISLDFVPSVISNSSYQSDNQITQFGISSCSLCRVNGTNGKVVNTSPTCSGITGQVGDIAVGESIQASVNFTDPDSSDQHRVEILSPLKPAMQFSTKSESSSSTSPIANDQIIPSDHGNSVTFNWSPSQADVGSYSIPVRFQQIYGQNGGYTDVNNCTLNFNVFISDSTPVCETIDLTSHLSDIRGQVNKLQNLLLSINQENQSLLAGAKQKDRQNYSTIINTYSQIVLEQIPAIPNPFVSCSSGYGSCTATSIANPLSRAREILPRLYCDGQKLTACSFIDNAGLKLLKVWKKNQIKRARVRGELTSSKLAIITYQFKKSSKKAANMSSKAFLGFEELNTQKFNSHFDC